MNISTYYVRIEDEVISKKVLIIKIKPKPKS